MMSNNHPSSKHHKTKQSNKGSQQNDSDAHASDLLMTSDHNDMSPLHDKKSDVSILKKAPIELQLQSQFKTRYGAWCVILLTFMASLSAVIWRGGAVEWLLLAVSSGTILYSGIGPILAAKKLLYVRMLSSEYSENGDLEVETTLSRTFRLPGMWYVIHEQYVNRSQLNAEPLAYRASFSPLFHGAMIVNYSFQQASRGSYEALPTEIVIGDWLGLTSLSVKKTSSQKFTVLPQFQVPEQESFVANNNSTRWKGEWKNDSEANHPTPIEHNDSIIQQMVEQGGQLISTQQGNSGIGDQTRPYIDGDSYRRLDVRAAARGRGWHTKLPESEFLSPKRCLILDQFALPYHDDMRNQLFEDMVQWSIADIHEQGERQPIFVITDDWSFEYITSQHSYELRCLLALAKADVQQHMKDRLQQLVVLIPQKSHITLYTGDWKETESWFSLAELAWMKGCTLEIHFATNNRVMTYAMREQHKALEQAGVRLVWRYSKPLAIQECNVIEGSERYATN